MLSDPNPPRRPVQVGPCTLIHGDALQCLPVQANVVITDPVWPNCPPGLLAGADGLQHGLLYGALAAMDGARTWVVILGFDSDPRWLNRAVPSNKPFIRTQSLPYAVPGYRGRLLGGDEIAYAFGAIPPGRGLIPGRVTTEVQPKSKRKVNHPCPRSPVHMAALVRWWSVDTDTVLDPFMGSGTTGIACVRGARRFIGIERDATHFATAVDRIRREVSQGRLL
ncbi:MAG: site-specific DNA-methyltransferase [Burkholderiales bacterium]|nr:site-specific DNA-methyltransferase [Burkholderiales bacterium]